MCFHLRSNVSTHWFLPCSLGFHSSLRNPEPWVSSRNNRGRMGKLTHLHWRPRPQYRWSITCWISMIWIELMVVSIPVLRRNRESKLFCRGKLSCFYKVSKLPKVKEEFPRLNGFHLHINGKRRGGKGKGRSLFVVVTVNFKKTHKNPRSNR